VPVVGAAYLACGAVGIFARGAPLGQALLPAEPFLSICRALMLLLIGDLIILFASVHAFASANRKTWSLIALAFAVVFATISSVNNILLLTLARGIDANPLLATLLSFRWPSAVLALELFAWGPVLGLALLFAAPVFASGKLQRTIRAALVIGGSLCLGNAFCFVVGDVRFSILGIIGYDFVLPVICILLTILFRGAESTAAQVI
jgi:hypothetical protein